jgi:hypothetical protein
MRRVLRAIVIVAPLVAAFAWFVPSGAEQTEPQREPAVAARPLPPGPPPQPRTITGVEFPDLRPSERIAEYIEHAPVPDSPARNPFRFARLDGDAGPARRAAALTRAANGTAPIVEAFPLMLVGIAEIEGESPHRVAIVSSPAALFHAVDGETLLERFKLGEVTATGVVVTDLTTGVQHVLSLR